MRNATPPLVLTEHCKQGCRDSCIFVLQWHLTERCNLRCSHCYQGSEVSPELDPSTYGEVLDQFEDLIDHIRDVNGCNIRGMVTLTGGEPLAHAGFFDLAAEVRRRTFMLGVLTNGTLVTEDNAQRLASLNPHFVQVSVDGKKWTHDAIRGVGSYDQACTGLRHLVAAGVKTSVSFTAHRENFREFGDVVDLAEELGVDCVWSDRLIPNGAGSALLKMSNNDVLEYIEIMMKARVQHAGRVYVKMQRALQFLAAGERPYECTAGKLLLTVLPDGTIYPCRRLPIPVGNVTKNTLLDVFKNNDVVNELRMPYNVAGCEHCDHLRMCKGGLRCLTYAVTGDLHRADVNCPLAKS